MTEVIKINEETNYEHLLDHYFNKGLIDSTFYKIALRNLWKKQINPFTQTLQKAICYTALKRKITLGHELIDKVFEDMTLLFNSESRDDGKGEKLDSIYFNNLYLICSHPNYTIDSVRPHIYHIRHELEDQNKGEWCLKKIVATIAKELKGIEK